MRQRVFSPAAGRRPAGRQSPNGRVYPSTERWLAAPGLAHKNYCDARRQSEFAPQAKKFVRQINGITNAARLIPHLIPHLAPGLILHGRMRMNVAYFDHAPLALRAGSRQETKGDADDKQTNRLPAADFVRASSKPPVYPYKFARPRMQSGLFKRRRPETFRLVRTNASGSGAALHKVSNTEGRKSRRQSARITSPPAPPRQWCGSGSGRICAFR
jgi:hypothetical protein